MGSEGRLPEDGPEAWGSSGGISGRFVSTASDIFVEGEIIRGQPTGAGVWPRRSGQARSHELPTDIVFKFARRTADLRLEGSDHVASERNASAGFGSGTG